MPSPQTNHRPFAPKAERDGWEDWEDGDAKEVSRKPEPAPALAPSSAGLRFKSQQSALPRSRQRAARDSPNFPFPAAAGQDTRTGRFVDAAALRALEGRPSSESTGSFAWLKRSKNRRSSSRPAIRIGPKILSTTTIASSTADRSPEEQSPSIVIPGTVVNGNNKDDDDDANSDSGITLFEEDDDVMNTSLQTEPKKEWRRRADEKKKKEEESTQTPAAVAAAGYFQPASASTSRAASVTAPGQPGGRTTMLSEEAQVVFDVPPPYTEKHGVQQSQQPQPQQQQVNVPLVSVFSSSVPSPGPTPDDIPKDSLSRGGIPLTGIPPPPTQTTAPSENAFPRLPDRPLGTFEPARFLPAVGSGPEFRAERKRRRLEKEDALTFRILGAWRGRGCMSENGCAGRPGPDGRRRRRLIMCLCVLVLVLLIGGAVVGGVLAHRLLAKGASTGADDDNTPASNLGPANASETTTPQPSATPIWTWKNDTSFPPIPMGLTTVMGVEPVTNATNGSVSGAPPSNTWSCLMPPQDDQAADASSPSPSPYSPWPAFVMDIQFDTNPSRWNSTAGDVIPTPVPTAAASGAVPLASAAASASASAAAAASNRLLVRSSGHDASSAEPPSLQRRSASADADASSFTPSPAPPYGELWFLGLYSDGIKAANKAGEPTPFYISMLESASDGRVGPDIVNRRRSEEEEEEEEEALRKRAEDDSGGGGGGQALGGSAPDWASLLPAPELVNGIAAPARVLPLPKYQQLRLYDRGLPTEHYGFMYFFNKTMFLEDITDDRTLEDDTTGGSSPRNATHVVTWLNTRYHVQIFTRMLADKAARLLETTSTPANTTRPGTMPYPVTVTTDLHGGTSQNASYVFQRRIQSMAIQLDNPTVYTVDMNSRSDVINPWSTYNPSYGAANGGTGGPKCTHQNWKPV